MQRVSEKMLALHVAEGLCPEWVPTPDTISCFYWCTKPIGHEDGHRDECCGFSWAGSW